MSENSEIKSWLDRPIFSFIPFLNGEILVFALIILLASVSRLYDLGVRVFSHDENLHIYFSWLYSIGKGYQYSPLMHGPLQFHLLALTYLLFGATDFTARFPHAIASILTIILLWKWRRYLGKAGTLIAAGLMLISPSMLYYGRYARNEAFIGVIFVLTLYAMLRYLETGKRRYLFLLTLATILHFTAKETAFIYTAQALLFLVFYLINRVTRAPWKNKNSLNGFLIALSIGILLAGAALGITLYSRAPVALNPSQTSAPILPGQITGTAGSPFGHFSAVSVLVLLSGSAFLLAVILLIVGYGWKNLCRERSFDMLILLGTFVLPQLAAFPVTALGWNPLDYQFTWPGLNLSLLWAEAPVRTVTFFFALTIASVVIGLFWDKKRWIGYAALFWGIYIILFTSIFSNWQGFFVGTVGALGYWLQQQGVHRGGQPWYYYLLIQIPVYEFLPALGVFLAAYFGLRHKSPAPLETPAALNPIEGNAGEETPDVALAAPEQDLPTSEGNYTFPLLIWWAVSSLVAFSLAGEKMPWLTVHITLPMILLAGWGLGQVIERVNWAEVRKQRGLLATVLLVVVFTSLASAIVSIMGANPPFQGKSLEQLSATGTFLLTAGVFLASAGGLAYLLSRWQFRDTLRIGVLVVFALLAILTGRTAIRAAFTNADNATEYLVYAHGASGIKDVMDQITTISSRIAGEQNLQVAYDNNLPNQGVSWSFKWYLRNYPNAISFDKPDNTLRNYPVIIVDQQNFDNIKPIVGTNYYQLDYIRMVWPNQDYFDLTWPRLWNVIANPAMREAVFQIWLNRDYTDYAKVTGETGLTLSNWQPSARMELFIRKDIATQMWEYGILQATTLQADPYAKGTTDLTADLTIGTAGNANEQLKSPRDLTIAPDGSIYVADSLNYRIEHFDASGKLIQSFGTISPGCPYAKVPPPNVPIGTFCEPWGVAVSPDGQWVYVADTWNHRIQKFSASGDPIKTWGTPNYDPASSGPFGLWGPRGIVVDALGHVLVADTGNKRIIVYDADGNFISQFGGDGADLGQFDEPVGLALDSQGNLYVADTWNQRIQVFVPNADKTKYTASTQWSISGWLSQSLDNKPYLAADQNGHIFATDPDSFRVLEFTTSGEFVHAWGQNGSAMDNFGTPSGIAVDSLGGVWVSDASNNRLMHFTVP
jgi:predicted membrane-bound mannosyltransferase/DNA-binding beta-propeller fold protein YncE